VPEPAFGRSRDQESLSAAESLCAVVASILRDVEPSAALIGFAEFPRGHYTLELAIAGRVNTSLILSKQLVEDVQTHPSAERALRQFLTSATHDPAAGEPPSSELRHIG
jgi:hypothetical protein